MFLKCGFYSFFFFSQDIEVLNLQSKIEEMTREREQFSKENDHIMNEVQHNYYQSVKEKFSH